eukprot:SAG31_NODE_22289_length_529_cov_1.060465_1_plen_128_part_10
MASVPSIAQSMCNSLIKKLEELDIMRLLHLLVQTFHFSTVEELSSGVHHGTTSCPAPTQKRPQLRHYVAPIRPQTVLAARSASIRTSVSPFRPHVTGVRLWTAHCAMEIRMSVWEDVILSVCGGFQHG